MEAEMNDSRSLVVEAFQTMNTAGVNSLLLRLVLSFLAASVTLADEHSTNLAAKSPGTSEEGESTRPPLSIRKFRLAPSAAPWLSRDAARTESSSDGIYGYLVEHGIDLAKAEGRQLFFNDRTGLLLVRATLPELDKIENALKARDFAVHQVLIETRVAEITQRNNKSVGFDWYLGNVLLENGQAGLQGISALSLNGSTAFTNPDDIFPTPIPQEDTDQPLTSMTAATTHAGILTEAQFRLVIRALEQREGVDLISNPKITTLSGRQARVQTGSPQPAITIPPFTAPGKDAKATWTRNYAPPEQSVVPQE